LAAGRRLAEDHMIYQPDLQQCRRLIDAASYGFVGA
jgi:hypothetical protein